MNDVAFKLKAWQIYVISVLVFSFPGVMILNSLGYGTGRGLGYDEESGLVEISVIGGLVLILYYLVRSKKKEKGTP